MNVCMYIRMYGPDTPLVGGYILSVIVSLLFVSSARTAMASVYSMYAHSYCCWCCSAHSVLVMWIALRLQCLLSGSLLSLQAVCAVNLCTEVEPVYNTCTTALHMCCSQSCTSKCSHNGLFAKCCGGEFDED